MLEIQNLSRKFGDIQALDQLSFTVNAGKIMGFVGSNGAGKSTTMRIILGIIAADTGKVLWHDQPLTYNERQHFGYMPEERGLYPKMSVKDQIIYFAQLHGMSAAASKKAMLHWTERLGLSKRRNDLVEKLSLGNQQRVQLATALVHNSTCLVLDEPFSGLDPIAVRVMSEVLKERAQAGIPIIFSSHQLEIVEKICDEVTIIANGKLVSSGDINSLRSQAKPSYIIRPANHALLEAMKFALTGLVPVTEVQTKQDSYSEYLLLNLNDTNVEIEQIILQTALAVGNVREFTPNRLPLSELYAEVVSTTDGSNIEEPETTRPAKGLLSWIRRK